MQRRIPTAALVGADALAYAIVVTAIATVAAMTLGVATGGGSARGNAFLFVMGWGLLAYATIRMWPTSLEDLDDPTPSDGESIGASQKRTRVQAIAREVPPVRWLRPPPPAKRVSMGGKVFLAGCSVLATSFLLETLLGVG